MESVTLLPKAESGFAGSPDRLCRFVNEFVKPFSKISICIENYTDEEYAPFYERVLGCYQDYIIDGDESTAQSVLEDAKRALSEATSKNVDVTGLPDISLDPAGYVMGLREREEKIKGSEDNV